MRMRSAVLARRDSASSDLPGDSAGEAVSRRRLAIDGGGYERSLTGSRAIRDGPVWTRHASAASLCAMSKGGEMGSIQALRSRVRAAGPDRGQGTVEYVGLILLVSLLMVGMVAAMKGFNGGEGTELAEVIVGKIKSAVNAITFR
jgi:hypothetical protein